MVLSLLGLSSWNSLPLVPSAPPMGKAINSPFNLAIKFKNAQHDFKLPDQEFQELSAIADSTPIPSAPPLYEDAGMSYLHFNHLPDFLT